MSPRKIVGAVALTVGLVIGIAVGGAWAANPFTDVPSSNGHASAIDAIFNAGISLGCGDGTTYCPNDFVRRDQMASFLARTAALGTNRFPVANARGDQQTYCALVKANPGAFKTAPCQKAVSLVQPSLSNPQFTREWTEADVEIGFDGLPVVVSALFGGIRVSACNNPACSRGVISTDMFSDVVVVESVDLAIGVDGLPVIAYFDVNESALKVIRCASPTCATGKSVSTVDDIGDVGRNPSLAFGGNGLPIITYYDATNSDLKLARCTAADCSASTKVALDTDGNVGRYSSLVLGTGGAPIVSYYDESNGNLLFLRCQFVTCDGGRGEAVPQVLDSTGNVGLFPSLTIGGDGFPIVSYTDNTGRKIKVAHCGNASCTSANSVSALEEEGTFGTNSSIAIGTNGLPVISYLDADDSSLMLAECTTKACTGLPTLRTLETQAVSGTNGIAIGVDGIPVVAYLNLGNVILARLAVA